MSRVLTPLKQSGAIHVLQNSLIPLAWVIDTWGVLCRARSSSSGAPALGDEEAQSFQQIATALSQKAGCVRLRQLQAALPAEPASTEVT